MIAFSDSGRFVVGESPDGSPQCLYDEAWGAGYLGFDRDRRRLVEIHQPNFVGSRATIQRRVFDERLSFCEPLLHPGIASVIESGKDKDGDLFYATEFVDGERLQSYLRRLHPVSRRVGMSLMLQMADVIGYLSDYPRVLASVRLEDFAVTLDRGRFAQVRLTDFGLDQDEHPVRDAALAARWIAWIGGLVEGIVQSRSIQLRDLADAAPSPGSPLDKFIQRLIGRPGTAALSELKRLKPVLLQAAGIEAKSTAHMRPEFRSIESHREVPHGPLKPLMCERTAIESQLDAARYRLLHAAAQQEAPEGCDWSPFRQQVDDRNQGRTAQITLLLPERLIDHVGTARLHEKMAHPYLKEHPGLIRTRAIASDANFTLQIEDHFHGFSLTSLLAERGRLSPGEVVALMREIDALLIQLEGANFDVSDLGPWQIWFHFDPALGGPKMRSVLAQESLLQWPAFEIRLRVNPATEALIQNEASSWTWLQRRMKGHDFSALALWMLEGDRFEWALIEGKADGEPFSWNPQLESFFERVVAHFDPENSDHRHLLVDSLASMFAPAQPLPVETLSGVPPSHSTEAETLNAEMFKGMVGGTGNGAATRRSNGPATRAHQAAAERGLGSALN